MSKSKVVCVVSVRNDSWILKNFLESAGKWADLIIVGDHNSTDNSVEIARQYDFVKVISLQPSSSFLSRRRSLLHEARKNPGNLIIFCLDSDEMLSSNWVESSDWEIILNANPGTCFQLEWMVIQPGLEQATTFWMPTIFVDDSISRYPDGESIHELRVPKTNTEIIKLYNIKLLHCNLLDIDRVFSKHRYYKCYEYIEFNKRPWKVNVFYQNTKYSNFGAPVVPMKEEWIKDYEWFEEFKEGKKNDEIVYWYDEEVLNYFDKYGVNKFSKLNIWDVDWNKKAKLLNRKGDYKDPRSYFEVWILNFIEKHKVYLKISPRFRYRLFRLIAKTVLRIFGW